ncbi:MAG: pyridoxamine 5'-phosphate oxidase family protein [Rhodospirillales bacterium]|nr:pyridoxamine 5'-phosphate oxidase family protein [Rhodospirillales bacterium]
MNADHIIRDEAALRAIYTTPPGEASLAKQMDHLHPHYQAFIRAAPFIALATNGAASPDVSPRGEGPGFVGIADARTLLLPDRPGNNRIDSLRNIVADPRVAILFLIPGIGETLRVNGLAEISVDPVLLERLAIAGKPPRSVIVVHVSTAFFQCSRAVVRADLWNPDKRLPRSALPSTGTMLADFTAARINGAAYDDGLDERVKATLF